MLYCQREAAETAIFLAEVAGRDRYTDWRRLLAAENDAHNEGLPRIALKMATGSGKTVVMAMLIAWQTLNKLANPRDARFATRFLVIAPGITIRDRLRVLLPGDPSNYYDLRDLVPPDPPTAGVPGPGRDHQLPHVPLAGRQRDPRRFRHHPQDPVGRQAARSGPLPRDRERMVSRVLRDFGGIGGRLATRSSSSTTRLTTAMSTSHCRPWPDRCPGVNAEQKEANGRSPGLVPRRPGVGPTCGRQGCVRLVGDAVLPRRVGLMEGYLFPWTVSDFSLMDAIESAS